MPREKRKKERKRMDAVMERRKKDKTIYYHRQSFSRLIVDDDDDANDAGLVWLKSTDFDRSIGRLVWHIFVVVVVGSFIIIMVI